MPQTTGQLLKQLSIYLWNCCDSKPLAKIQLDETLDTIFSQSLENINRPLCQSLYSCLEILGGQEGFAQIKKYFDQCQLNEQTRNRFWEILKVSRHYPKTTLTHQTSTYGFEFYFDIEQQEKRFTQNEMKRFWKRGPEVYSESSFRFDPFSLFFSGIDWHQCDPHHSTQIASYLYHLICYQWNSKFDYVLDSIMHHPDAWMWLCLNQTTVQNIFQESMRYSNHHVFNKMLSALSHAYGQNEIRNPSQSRLEQLMCFKATVSCLLFEAIVDRARGVRVNHREGEKDPQFLEIFLNIAYPEKQINLSDFLDYVKKNHPSINGMKKWLEKAESLMLVEPRLN